MTGLADLVAVEVHAVELAVRHVLLVVGLLLGIPAGVRVGDLAPAQVLSDRESRAIVTGMVALLRRKVRLNLGDGD